MGGTAIGPPNPATGAVEFGVGRVELRSQVHRREFDQAHGPEPGHWEGDLIVGAFNRSAIATLVERTTRFTTLVHLAGPSRSEALRDGLIDLFAGLPPELCRSLTWDQGSEMAHHHAITEATGTPIYLCHPGRPWERPSNENTNGLLRDYFPKSSDLQIYSPHDLRHAADELNRRPRKTLAWQTPERLFATLLAAHV